MFRDAATQGHLDLDDMFHIPEGQADGLPRGLDGPGDLLRFVIDLPGVLPRDLRAVHDVHLGKRPGSEFILRFYPGRADIASLATATALLLRHRSPSNMGIIAVLGLSQLHAS